MDKLVENIINEKFASKAQQRFFYAKANEKGASKKEKSKWKKWSKEFSDKTNFSKLPEKKKKVKEEEVDEQYFDLNPGNPGHDMYNYVAVAHFANGKKVKEVLDHFPDVQAFAEKVGKHSPVKMVVDRFDEKGNKKTKTWFFNYTDDSWELEKKEQEVDEVVDELGNIATGREPTDASTKGITQKNTTDQVVKTGAGSMGIHGVHGTHTSLRYWAESDMSKALGYEKTMGDDDDYEDAKEYFKKDLDLDDADAEERMSQLGYDKKLAKKGKDKVRLVENPKQFIEDYIDEVLLKKKDNEELVNKNDSEKEINPIIKKQLASLKKSISNNNLSISDVVKYLKDKEENLNEIFDSNDVYPFRLISENEEGNLRFLKYSFTTKDDAVYTVIIRIDSITKGAKLDFMAQKGWNSYEQTNTNDKDSIKVFNTIIKIAKTHIDEIDNLYVASADDRRLNVYEKIAKNQGYKIYKMNKSLMIYLK